MLTLIKKLMHNPAQSTLGAASAGQIGKVAAGALLIVCIFEDSIL